MPTVESKAIQGNKMAQLSCASLQSRVALPPAPCRREARREYALIQLESLLGRSSTIQLPVKYPFVVVVVFLFFLPLFFSFFFPSEIILSHFDSSVHMTCFYFYYLYNRMMFLLYNNFSPLYFLSSRYLSFNNYAVVTLLFHHSFNSYSCSFYFFFPLVCVLH